MLTKKRINFVITLISMLIALLTIFTLFSEYKVSEYENNLDDLLVQQNNRLLEFVRNQVQLSTYLQVIPYPEEYDLYGGEDVLKSNISKLNSEQKKLNLDVVNLANQINDLKARDTIWEPIRDISYIITLFLALTNFVLGIFTITKYN